MRASLAACLLASVIGAAALLVHTTPLLTGAAGRRTAAVETPDGQRVFVAGAAARLHHAPDWPPPELATLCRSDAVPPLPAFPVAGHEAAVAVVIHLYRAEGINYRVLIQEYSPAGDYLNYSQVNDYLRDPDIRFDNRGIPMVAYAGAFQYNPVTIAQYGLTLYGQVLHGAPALNEFLNVADFLVEWQDGRGALPHRFDYPYYLQPGGFKAGWVSGMSQGLAMSVFSRAYSLTGDTRYFDAGEKAAAFIPTPSSSGGVLAGLGPLGPHLGGFETISEYPATTDAFTLNGFMVAALGAYDWWQLDPADIEGPHALARRLFECSVASLAVMLPRYDIGGYSMYDLGPITHGSQPNLKTSYHAFHIALLHALYGITGHEIFAEFEHRWAATVD